MTWFRVDDKLHDHKKARRARKGHDSKPRDAAPLGLWVLAGSWCMANLTDGFVPADELDRWDSDAGQLAQQLVDAELWEHAERDGEAGFQFHEWDEWQHTSAYIQKRRDDAANRMRRRRANHSADVVSANTERTRVARSSHVRKPPTQPNHESTRADARVSETDADEWFDRFWQQYPKKVAKKAARKAWDKARADVDAAAILQGLHAAAAGWEACETETRFIPNPATWLNQGRWDDQQQLPSTSSTTPPPLPPDPDDPEPDPRTDPDEHLAWRQRRSARKEALAS